MSGNSKSEMSDLAKAAYHGDKELLEGLLENGANPNIPEANGNYPLHEATQYGETECASLLLAHKGKR